MTEFDRGESQLGAQEVLFSGARLLEHFGVVADPSVQPDEFIEAIGQLDPRYQGGRELVRWQLEADETAWAEDTKAIILDTARSMRMLETETPLAGTFDVVIVLGGARQANLDRARYAVQAAHEGLAHYSHLVVAGSSRKLNEQEQENVANYAPGALTEFDLCAAAAKRIALEYPGTVTSQFLVDDERAGTPVIIDRLLNELEERSALPEALDTSIAAVTTQIYQVATGLDMRRVAEELNITKTFAAGNPSDPNIVARRTPATYLSEVVRTLRAATHAAAESSE